jgi:hypothetical protein
MSWECEHLWTKARLFFEKAFQEDHNDPAFGLWCAMGLELLARSSVAKFSPMLLAEPDKEQKNLLIALNLSSTNVTGKSIAMNQVINLCKMLISDFTDEQVKLALALTGRRNEEIHSGGAAFAQYPSHQWRSGFYKCCKILADSQEKSLEDLFGNQEGVIAKGILIEMEEDVLKKTKDLIAKHKREFESKEEEDKSQLIAEAVSRGETLSHQKHHRVQCPACACVATIQGDTYGSEQVKHEDDDRITIRQSVKPTKFECKACGLKLNGYRALLSAGVAEDFSHKMTYTPEEYYGLINPNDESAIRSVAEDHGYYFEDAFFFSND